MSSEIGPFEDLGSGRPKIWSPNRQFQVQNGRQKHGHFCNSAVTFWKFSEREFSSSPERTSGRQGGLGLQINAPTPCLGESGRFHPGEHRRPSRFLIDVPRWVPVTHLLSLRVGDSFVGPEGPVGGARGQRLPTSCDCRLDATRNRK